MSGTIRQLANSPVHHDAIHDDDDHDDDDDLMVEVVVVMMIRCLTGLK